MVFNYIESRPKLIFIREHDEELYQKLKSLKMTLKI